MSVSARSALTDMGAPRFPTRAGRGRREASYAWLYLVYSRHQANESMHALISRIDLSHFAWLYFVYSGHQANESMHALISWIDMSQFHSKSNQQHLRQVLLSD